MPAPQKRQGTIRSLPFLQEGFRWAEPFPSFVRQHKLHGGLPPLHYHFISHFEL